MREWPNASSRSARGRIGSEDPLDYRWDSELQGWRHEPEWWKNGIRLADNGLICPYCSSPCPACGRKAYPDSDEFWRCRCPKCGREFTAQRDEGGKMRPVIEW